MKTVTIGESNPLLAIKTTLDTRSIKNHHIPVKCSEEPFKGSLLTVNDLYAIQQADVCFIFGTWGSTNSNRVWHPKHNKRSQAWVENINTFFTNILNSYNKKFIVFETGTLCRIRNTMSDVNGMSWKDSTPLYYRMGLNHWTYGKAKFCKPKTDRLNIYIKNNLELSSVFKNQFNNHTWENNKDGDIIICPGLENDPTATKPVEQFVEDSYTKIREHTDRNIFVKPHPGSLIDYSKYDEIDKKTPLKNLKERLYCAVLDNSTSIFELTFLGIPCFTSSANVGYKLKNNDLSKRKEIYYSDKHEMKQWYNEMAHTEFTFAEISSNHKTETDILNYIRELIE